MDKKRTFLIVKKEVCNQKYFLIKYFLFNANIHILKIKLIVKQLKIGQDLTSQFLIPKFL